MIVGAAAVALAIACGLLFDAATRARAGKAAAYIGTWQQVGMVRSSGEYVTIDALRRHVAARPLGRAVQFRPSRLVIRPDHTCELELPSQLTAEARASAERFIEPRAVGDSEATVRWRIDGKGHLVSIGLIGPHLRVSLSVDSKTATMQWSGEDWAWVYERAAGATP